MAPSSWPGFTSGQVTFAERLAADTGLNVGVIAAWEQAEENGSAAAGRQASGNHNWLNIGYFDSGPGQIAFNSAFSDPTSGADQTARFLKGTWGGASSGIRGIMGTVGKSPQAQISTIQTSGWASGGYPSLPGIYNGLSSSIKNAAPGGVAGAGGTGTLANDALAKLLLGKNQANFTVGDPTNPDEDYWTAINRLAQERYWYLFSDGETLYLADGPDLMKQEPAARLDRIGNLDQINHLSYTWDNPLALDTPLLTTRGWKTMGTVAAGDHVYAEDGNSTRVLGTSEVFPDKPCFELTFADDAKIVASDDHHWKVKSAPDYDAPWQNLTTQEIADNWRYQTINRYRVRCDAVPQYSPIELPPEALRGKRHRTTMSITNVQSVTPVPTRCIMVKDESHVFLVGRTFVPTRNTAWQYAATHKKRKRAQRRTSLAKVVSPVEATLELICAIDEARAGDVIEFSNAGPGDGAWLVGDCRRSVFEILSEINMVVALTPLSESSLNPAGINSNNLSSLLTGKGNGSGAAIANAAKMGLKYKSGYQQVRPYPQTLTDCAHTPTDCSGFATLCYKWAGAPDPNHSGYNGQGNTGTLEAHGQKTNTPQAGDLAFWSSPDHVAVMIDNGGQNMIEWGGPPGPIKYTVGGENHLHAAFLGYRTYS